MSEVQRTWRVPTTEERLTWEEVDAYARSIPGAESDLIVLPQQLIDAVDGAVEALSEHSWRMESWSARLTAYPDSGIALPWSPTGVVRCAWGMGTSEEMPQLLTSVPSSWYTVSGQHWYFTRGKGAWPCGTDGTVYWSMEATGRPATRREDPVYCTVPMAVLRPFVELEVSAMLDVLDGQPRGKVLKEKMRGRSELLMKTRVAQRPATLIAGENGIAGGFVVWELWGDTYYTFAELP